MAAPRSRAEQNLLSILGGLDANPWIDFTDAEEEGTWVFGDEGAQRAGWLFPVGDTSRGWRSPQPDNTNDNEHCAQIYKYMMENGAGGINDGPCTSPGWTSSGAEAVPACALPYVPCPDGWHMSTRGDRCQARIDRPDDTHLTFDVLELCGAQGSPSYGAVPGSVRDAEESAHVNSMQDFSNMVLGGGDHAFEGTNFMMWYDGTPFGYTDYRSGEPNDFETGEDLLEMRLIDAEWNDVDDTTEGRDVLCQFSTLCPRGYQLSPLGDRCLFVDWSASAQSYADATTYCEERGDMLVEIRSPEEASLVSLMGGQNHNLWVGLAYDSDDSAWRWSTRAAEADGYAPWAASEPLTNDCALMHPFSTSGPGSLYATDCTATTDNSMDNIPVCMAKKPSCSGAQASWVYVMDDDATDGRYMKRLHPYGEDTCAADLLLDSSSVSSSIEGLVLDSAAGFAYWSDGTVIKRARTDGTELTDFISTSGSTYWLALDIPDDRIYWSTTSEGVIRRASLSDGSGEEVFYSFSGSPEVMGIEIDQRNRVLWAVDYAQSAVWRIWLDSREGTEIVLSGTDLISPVEIRLDHRTNRALVNDHTHDKILDFPLDAEPQPTVTQRANSGVHGAELGGVNTIAVDSEARVMYSSDTNSDNAGYIQRADVDGTNFVSIATFAGSSIERPATMALLYRPCMECSSEDRVCAPCPTGGSGCRRRLQKFIATDRGAGKVFSADADGSNGAAIMTAGVDFTDTSGTGLDGIYTDELAQVFWISDGADSGSKVYKSYIDMSEVAAVDLDGVTERGDGIAIDRRTRQIFLTDWANGAVWRADEDGLNAENIHVGDSFHDIDIWAPAERLYLVNTSPDELTSFRLDASEEWTFTISGFPEAVAFNARDQEIYYRSGTNTIDRFSLRTHTTELFVTAAGTVDGVSFSIVEDALFWCENNDRVGVFRAPLKDGSAITEVFSHADMVIPEMVRPVHRICVECDPNAGMYQATACTATSEGTCERCTACGLGEYEVSPCTALSDRVCSACPTGAETCRVTGAALFVGASGTGDVRRYDIDGGSALSFAASTAPTALAFDTVAGDVWYTQGGGADNTFVKKARYSDAGGTTSLVDEAAVGDGMTIDTLHGYFYTCRGDSTPDTLARGNTDGSGSLVSLLTPSSHGVQRCSALAIDVMDSIGRVYMADTEAHRIVRVYGDGAGYEVVITSPHVTAPRGLAIDELRGKLYIAEDQISRCNLDGSSFEVVHASTPGASGVALDLRAATPLLYWSEETAGTVVKSLLTAGSAKTTVISGLSSPTTVGLLKRACVETCPEGAYAAADVPCSATSPGLCRAWPTTDSTYSCTGSTFEGDELILREGTATTCTITPRSAPDTTTDAVAENYAPSSGSLSVSSVTIPSTEPEFTATAPGSAPAAASSATTIDVLLDGGMPDDGSSLGVVNVRIVGNADASQTTLECTPPDVEAGSNLALFNSEIPCTVTARASDGTIISAPASDIVISKDDAASTLSAVAHESPWSTFTFTYTSPTNGAAEEDTIRVTVRGATGPTQYFALVQPPELTDVDPRAAHVDGGTLLTLLGTFSAALSLDSITVDGAGCTSPTRVSQAVATCTTTASSSGVGDVVVTTAAGTATLSSAIEYLDDAVVSSFTLTDGTAALAGTSFGQLSVNEPTVQLQNGGTGESVTCSLDSWDDTSVAATCSGPSEATQLVVTTAVGAVTLTQPSAPALSIDDGATTGGSLSVVLADVTEHVPPPTGYELYFGEAADSLELWQTPVSGGTFLMPGLKPRQPYTFQARSLSGPFTAGPLGAVLEAETSEATWPSSVRSLAAVDGATTGGAVALEWLRPTDNGGVDLTRYEVTATPTGGGDPIVVEVAHPSAADDDVDGYLITGTVSGLIAETEYDFTVDAFHSVDYCLAGDPTTSDPVTVTTTAETVPTAVLNVALTPASGDMDVAWDIPVDVGGVAITDYTVEIQLAGSDSWVSSTTGDDSQSITLSGLVADTAYEVRVAGHSAAGQGAWSSVAATTTLAPVVPGAPTNIAASSILGGSLDITWDEPTNTGGAPVLSYRIRSAPPPHDTFTTVADCGSDPSVRSCTLLGLDASTEYHFVALATNVAGEGVASAAESATTTAATPPFAPESVSLAPDTVSCSNVAGAANVALPPCNPSGGALTITWESPLDAGGAPIDDYEVEYEVTGSGSPTTQVVDSTSFDDQVYSITGLTASTSYDVSVRAIGAGGNGEWQTTTVSTAAVSKTSAPTGILQDSATGGSICFSWDAPTDDGGQALSSVDTYRVYSAAVGSEASACLDDLLSSCTYVVSVAATEQSSCVGGLSTGSSEGFRVIPFRDEAAQTASDRWVGTTTAPTAPTEVVNLASTAISSTFFELVWEPPVDTGGVVIDTYTITWASTDDGEDQVAGETTVDAPEQTVRVGGLPPQTEFSVSVAATNGATHTGPDETITVETAAGLLGTAVFREATASVVEGDTITLTIDRTGGSFGTLNAVVNLGVGDSDTAVAAEDFSAFSGIAVSWDNDVVVTTVDVPTLDDSLYENPDEVFTVEVVIDGASEPEDGGTTLITILDDGDAGSVAFSSDTFSVAEDEARALVPIQRSDGADAAPALSLSVDITWEDGTVVSDVATVPAGAAEAEFEIPFTDDDEYQLSREFTVSLNSVTGGATAGSPALITVTIEDDGDLSIPGTPPAPLFVSHTGGSISVLVAEPANRGGAVLELDEYIIAVADQTSDGCLAEGAFDNALELTHSSCGDLEARQCQYELYESATGPLRQSSGYCVRVHAVNSLGTSPPSSASVFFTGTLSLPSAPIDLSVASFTGGSAVVQWGASLDSGGSSIDDYEVRVAQTGTDDEPVVAGTVAADAVSLELPIYNLLKETEYTVEVVATRTGAESLPGSVQVSTSAATIPSAPVWHDSSIVAVTGGGAELAFSASADAGGIAADDVQYRFLVWPALPDTTLPNKDLQAPRVFPSPSGSSWSASWILEHLIAESRYVVRLQVSNGEVDNGADSGGRRALSGTISIASGASSLTTTADLRGSVVVGDVLYIPSEDATVVVADTDPMTASFFPITTEWTGDSVAGANAEVVWTAGVDLLLETTEPSIPKVSPAPELVRATGGLIELSLLPAADTGGTPIISHDAYAVVTTDGLPLAMVSEDVDVHASQVGPPNADDDNVGVATVRVNALEPETSYTFASISHNALSVCLRDDTVRTTGDVLIVSTTEATLPSAPRGLATTDVGGGRLTVAWTDPEDHGVGTAETLQYSLFSTTGGCCTEDQDIDDPSPAWEELYTGTDLNHEQLGLNASTCYCVRVHATNSVGDGEFGPAVPFSTGPPEVPSEPTAFATTEVSGGIIGIEWGPALDEGGTPVTQYHAEISLSGEFDDAASVSEEGLSVSFARAHGVQADTEHHMRIRGENAAGLGPWSESIAITTPSADTPSPPLNVRRVLETTTGGALSIAWDDPFSDGGTVLDSFVVSVSGHDDVTVAGTERSVMVYGLNAGWAYDVSVVVANDAGFDSEPSDTVSMSTSASPTRPSLVQSLAVSATTGGSVTLTFAVPIDTGGSFISKYDVFVDNAPIAAASTASLSVRVVRLPASTLHTFSVRAYNGALYSEPVSIQASTAAASVPAKPISVTAFALSAEAIRVEWQPPVDVGGSAVTQYTIEYEDTETNDVDTVVVPAPADADAAVSGDISGISGGTYDVVVYAHTAAGQGAASTLVTVAALDPTGQVRELTLDWYSGTRAKLRWRPPTAVADQSFESYVIRWSTDVSMDPGAEFELATGDVDPASFVSYEITSDVVPDTDYFVVVYAKSVNLDWNGDGLGLVSDQLTFTSTSSADAHEMLTTLTDVTSGEYSANENMWWRFATTLDADDPVVVRFAFSLFDLECDHDEFRIFLAPDSGDPLADVESGDILWAGGCDRPDDFELTMHIDSSEVVVTQLTSDSSVHSAGVSFRFEVLGDADGLDVGAISTGSTLSCPRFAGKECGGIGLGSCNNADGTCACQSGRTGEDCSALVMCPSSDPLLSAACDSLEDVIVVAPFGNDASGTGEIVSPTSGGSVPKPYATIERALSDLGAEEATIVLYPGEYQPTVEMDGFEVTGKTFTLTSVLGAGETSVNCDAESTDNGLQRWLRLSDSDTTISAVTITNCVASHGGAVHITGGTTLFHDAEFVNNAAAVVMVDNGADDNTEGDDPEGGGDGRLLEEAPTVDEEGGVGGTIYLDGAADVTLGSSLLISQSAAVLGGAIAVRGESTLTVSTGSRVTASTASYGGAVWLEGDSRLAGERDEVLSGNNASHCGGSIAATTGDNEIEGIVASTSHSDGNGGGLCVLSGTIDATDVTFDDCSADGHGGGVFVHPSASATLLDSSITDCRASGGGGVCLAVGASFSGGECDAGAGGDTTISSSSAEFGGGVLLDTNAEVSCVRINECSATSGGAVAVSISTAPQGDGAVLEDIVAMGNAATSAGGGVHAAGGATVTIVNSEFHGNYAPTGGELWVGSATTVTGDATTTIGPNGVNPVDGGDPATGGCAALHGGSHITSFEVADCTADNGGAVAVLEANVTLDGVVISSGIANEYGGGMLLAAGSSVALQSVNITGCAAVSGGGGIAALSGSSVVMDSLASLVANVGGAMGGAVLCDGCASLVGMKIDGQFANDGNALYGGGIAVRGDEQITTISDTTILKSIAMGDGLSKGGGLFVDEDAMVELVDVYIGNCSAADGGEGGGMYLGMGASVRHQHVVMEFNEATSGGSLALIGAEFAHVGVADGEGVPPEPDCICCEGGAHTRHGSANLGGNVYARSGDTLLAGVCITDGVAVDEGGGLWAFDTALSLAFVDIEFNHASRSGGGLQAMDAALDWRGVVVRRNTAGSRDVGEHYGGGVTLQRTAATHHNVDISFNTNQLDGEATGLGGGLYLEDSSSTGVALSITNNAARNGGGVSVEGDNALSGVEIRANAANNGGGMHIHSNGNLEVRGGSTRGCAISNNQATLDDTGGDGGAIAVVSGGTVTVTECDMSFNTADGSGGAINLDSSGSAALVDVELDENTAGQNGGVASVTGHASIELEDVIVGRATAASDGGCLYLFGEQVSAIVTGSSLQACTADRGGAVYADRSSFDLIDTDITATSDRVLPDADPVRSARIGGGVYVIDAPDADSESRRAYVSGCTFLGLTAENGGAINVDESPAGLVTVADTTITDCEVDEFGGAINIEVSNFAASRLTITSASALFDGGAIFASRSDVELSELTVTGCNAVSGGAIMAVRGSHVTCDDCTMSGNVASVAGAGVYADRTATIELDSTTISGNTAGGTGGGIYAIDASAVRLTDCTVSTNTAADGGGIGVSRKTTLVTTDTIILNNHAVLRGGGMFVSGSPSLALVRTSIGDNLAGNGGGGIYIAESQTLDGTAVAEVTLTDCDVSGNTASGGPGGGFYIGSGSILMHGVTDGGCVVAGNRALLQGGGMSVIDTGASVTVNSCELSGNAALSSVAEAEETRRMLTPGPAAPRRLATDTQGAVSVGGALHTVSPSAVTASLLRVTGNSATTGAGVYWVFLENVPPFDCDGCEVASNNGPDLATQGLGTQLERLPSDRWMSGVGAAEPIAIAVVDFYGNVAVGDNDAQCDVASVEGGDVANGQATAQAGRIIFSGLTIKAPAGAQPEIGIACNVRTAVAGSPWQSGENDGLIPISVEVGECQPGYGPTLDSSCVRCSEGTYSPDGLACSPCPEGGDCLYEEDGVRMGVAHPSTLEGYWLSGAMQDVFNGDECEDLIEMMGTCSWGQRQEESGSCTDIAVDPSLLYLCRTNRQFYRCDVTFACRAGITVPADQLFRLNETAAAAQEPCSDGYRGPLCRICVPGFNLERDRRCTPCFPDDAEAGVVPWWVKAQVVVAGILAVAVFALGVLFYILGAEHFVKVLVALCRCPCICEDKKCKACKRGFKVRFVALIAKCGCGPSATGEPYDPDHKRPHKPAPEPETPSRTRRIRQRAKRAAAAVTRRASGAADGIKRRASDAADGIKRRASDAAEGIKRRASDAADGVKRRTSDAGNKVVGAGSAVKAKAVGGIGALLSQDSGRSDEVALLTRAQRERAAGHAAATDFEGEVDIEREEEDFWGEAIESATTALGLLKLEKLKMLIAWAQLLAAFKNSFHVPWPQNAADVYDAAEGAATFDMFRIGRCVAARVATGIHASR